MTTFLEKRLKAIADARLILDTAKAQSRGMNADEVIRYDLFMAESDRLKASIDRENVQTQLDADASSRAGQFREVAKPNGSSDAGSSIALGKAERCVDAVRKSGCAYAAETARGERLSLGKIVLAMATGNHKPRTARLSRLGPAGPARQTPFSRVLPGIACRDFHVIAPRGLKRGATRRSTT
jgi:hypothetical protein